jgi:serine acetyltransferase
MAAALVEDARRLHALRHPGRRASTAALLWVGLGSQGVRLLACQRILHRFEHPRPRSLRRLLPVLAAKALVVMARRYVMVFGKGVFAPEMPLEPGIVFSDRGHLVVGARSIGTGTVIGERTTIGMNLTPDQRGWIGRNVWIGSHCIVYGDIRIGDGVTILPHTLLTRSVPAGAIAEGNPARIRVDEIDHRELRRRHFGFAGVEDAPAVAATADLKPEAV